MAALSTARVMESVMPGTDFIAEAVPALTAVSKSVSEDFGRPAFKAAADTSSGSVVATRLLRMVT